MGMHRSALRRRRREDAVETKAENLILKTKERVRRDARMIDTIKDGTLPYSPNVMSWLSRALNKASTKIKPEDIKSLLN